MKSHDGGSDKAGKVHCVKQTVGNIQWKCSIIVVYLGRRFTQEDNSEF